MRIESNAGVLALKHRSRSQRFGPVMRQAEEAFAQKLLAEAKHLSTGKRSRNMLRAKERDHPYAIRRVGGVGASAKPWIVNRHTSTFYEGWRVEVRSYRKRITVTLKNVAPYAKYFDGRPHGRMIGRPIAQKAWENTRGDRQQLLRRARRAVDRGDKSL